MKKVERSLRWRKWKDGDQDFNVKQRGNKDDIQERKKRKRSRKAVCWRQKLAAF